MVVWAKANGITADHSDVDVDRRKGCHDGVVMHDTTLQAHRMIGWYKIVWYGKASKETIWYEMQYYEMARHEELNGMEIFGMVSNGMV